MLRAALRVMSKRELSPSAANGGAASKKARSGGGKGKKGKPFKPGGMEETASFDIRELLGAMRIEEMTQQGQTMIDWRKRAEREYGFSRQGKDVEVTIQSISAHGDGLAVIDIEGKPSRVLSVPFTLPGETVTAHVHRHESDILLSHADLVDIKSPSPLRQADVPADEDPSTSSKLTAVRSRFGNRVQCQYFGRCSGCQYQPLSYEKQLELKQNVIRKAFANFSGLDSSLVPEAGPTLPSPMQYNYRTKLTPHFQAPHASFKGKEKEWRTDIGFEEKGRKRVIDIEECPIATRVINDGMPSERKAVKDNIAKYKRGATILLRDSLPPRPEGATRSSISSSEPHVCITDHHATVREQIALSSGELVEYEQVAGSFFQNNNSILPSLIEYISSQLPKRAADSKRYLVDAYCGSGLFALALADQFDEIEGVEIDRQSVKWATRNAAFNDGPGRGKVRFIEGQAEAIFKDIKFPAGQTTIVIDPPRKGCDELFLDQLLAFGPETIVYVSCNVHTQARDIGYLVRAGAPRKAEGAGADGYKIDSIRAADLFPNTHHAEGVAVLSRVRAP